MAYWVVLRRSATGGLQQGGGDGQDRRPEERGRRAPEDGERQQAGRGHGQDDPGSGGRCGPGGQRPVSGPAEQLPGAERAQRECGHRWAQAAAGQQGDEGQAGGVQGEGDQRQAVAREQKAAAAQDVRLRGVSPTGRPDGGGWPPCSEQQRVRGDVTKASTAARIR